MSELYSNIHPTLLNIQPHKWIIIGLLISLGGIALHMPLFIVILMVVISFFFVVNFLPATTIALTILLGQIIQFELISVFGLRPDLFLLGSLNLRLSDPLLLCIIVNLISRMLRKNWSLQRFITKEGLFLFLFLLFLFFQAMRNIGTYGINALGEFRTYYQSLFLVLYLVATTKTEKERAKIFKLLVSLALLHILLGLIRGAFLFEFKFAAYDKWLSAFGSLALLYGLFALFIAKHENSIPVPKWMNTLFYILGISLIFISANRSVWLAGVAGLMFLVISRRLSLGRQIKLLFLLPVIIAVLLFVFHTIGKDLDEFIQTRLLAFTDYQADTSASWRYYYWLSTLEQIIQNPWFGVGLGKHFDIYIPEIRKVITTSPHNFYLTILYQVGIIGLLLYGIWVSLIATYFHKAKLSTPSDRAILATGVLVLFVAHCYWIAYSLEKEFFTWSFIGLALSCIVHKRKSGVL